MTVRVILADDQPLVRAGIAMLLSRETDLEVVAEAGDGLEAVDLARRHAPDVVVMDVRMPNLDGVAATRKLTSDDFSCIPGHTVKVLILTTFHSDETVYDALRAGASGFLLKDGVPTELITAVQLVARGEAWLDPRVTRGVIDRITTQPGPASSSSALLERLTARETEILKLMAQGLSNTEIAELLVLAEATVKTHVCRIRMKLEVRDRTQAVVAAYQGGLVAVQANQGQRRTGR